MLSADYAYVALNAANSKHRTHHTHTRTRTHTHTQRTTTTPLSLPQRAVIPAAGWKFI